MQQRSLAVRELTRSFSISGPFAQGSPDGLPSRGGQGQCTEGCHLALAQSRRAPGMRPIAQALDARCVERLNPAMVRRPLPPPLEEARPAGRGGSVGLSRPAAPYPRGSLSPVRTPQIGRGGEHPPRRAVVGLDLGMATQLGSWDVGPSRHGSGHGVSLLSQQPSRASPILQEGKSTYLEVMRRANHAAMQDVVGGSARSVHCRQSVRLGGARHATAQTQTRVSTSERR